MKYVLSLLFALSIACGATTEVRPTEPLDEVPSLRDEQEQQPAPITLSVIGTADLHGHLEQLPLLAGYVNAVRAENPTVLIDGGDMWQGTLASNEAEGAPIVAAYNAMGYDAVTVGNHEFDYGPAGPPVTCDHDDCDPRGALLARVAEADFPVLSANLHRDPAELDGLDESIPPRVLIDKGGIRVGIIGVTTEDTLHTTIGANVSDLTVEPLAESISRAARSLREQGAQVVLVAAHAGGECEHFDNPEDLSSCDDESEIFTVARALEPGAVDVIVAGHTHQATAHRVAGVPIISSYARGSHFGRVDLVIEGGEVQERVIFPPTELCESPACDYEVEGETMVQVDVDPEIAQVVAPAIDRANARLAEELGGTLEVTFEANYRAESSAGNFLADAVMGSFDAMAPATLGDVEEVDVALINAGGVRASLPEGPVTYGAIYEALPFDNRFATVQISAADFAQVLAGNARSDSGILIISGLTARGTCVRGELQVRLYREGSRRPIRGNTMLRVLTSDYLATTRLFADSDAQIDVHMNGPLMREAAVGYLRAQGAELDGRAESYLPEGARRLSFPSERPVSCE